MNDLIKEITKKRRLAYQAYKKEMKKLEPMIVKATREFLLSRFYELSYIHIEDQVTLTKSPNNAIREFFKGYGMTKPNLPTNAMINTIILEEFGLRKTEYSVKDSLGKWVHLRGFIGEREDTKTTYGFRPISVIAYRNYTPTFK